MQIEIEICVWMKEKKVNSPQNERNQINTKIWKFWKNDRHHGRWIFLSEKKWLSQTFEEDYWTFDDKLKLIIKREICQICVQKSPFGS